MPDEKFITPKVRLSFTGLTPPEGPQPPPVYWAETKFDPAMAIVYRTAKRPWWQRWMWWLSPVVAVIDFETFKREAVAAGATVKDDADLLDDYEADAAADTDPLGHAPDRKRRTRAVVEFDDSEGDGWRKAVWRLSMALQAHPEFKGRRVRTMHPARLVQAAALRKDAGLTSPKT